MTRHKHYELRNTGSALREIVFGMEDGMVSTLGAITGIAVGSQDHYTVLLAGIVIISVESISMGIGSYLASKSQDDLRKRVIREEKEEIRDYPREEKHELHGFLIRDGWPESIADQMVDAANRDDKLMLKEMQYRELNISSQGGNSLQNGIKMFLSYVVGGLIALFAYFFLPISTAMILSIIVTLVGLFTLGAITSRYTKVSWRKSGLRILLLGGIALAIGLIVGELVKVS
ncbi:VIT1/CCC1 transporter family protein [Patescibacteria group bacterium]